MLKQLTVSAIILGNGIHSWCFQVTVEHHERRDVKVCKNLSGPSHIASNEEVLVLCPVLHVLYTHSSLVLCQLLAINVHGEAILHTPRGN